MELLALALLAACATAPELPPVPNYTPAALAKLHYKAVLIGGDSSVPVFDNATGALQSRLIDRQLPAGDVQRMSAAPAVIALAGVRSSTLDLVQSTIGHIQPEAGQGCIVFATSHGGPGRGLYLSRTSEYLTPRDLDIALAKGCGNAPTIVIMSGCYTGVFAKSPMASTNRVILTASREDRPSFGCGAGREYTVYDKCLLDSFDASGRSAARITWLEIHNMTRSCVTQEEKRGRFGASEPQGYFGEAVLEMPLPSRLTK